MQYRRKRTLAGAWALLLVALALPGHSVPSPASGEFSAPSGPGVLSMRLPTVIARLSPTAYATLRPEEIISAEHYGSFVWVEMGAAYARTLRSAGVPFEEASYATRIGLQDQPFDTRQPLHSIPAALQEATASGEPGFQLVQFSGPVRDSWLRELEEKGLKPLQYVPQNAYLCWRSGLQAETVEGDSKVRWSSPFPAAFKVARSLAAGQGLIENVNVLIYDDGRLSETLTAVEALGGCYVQDFPMPLQESSRMIDAIFTLPAERLADVARLPSVFRLDYASPKPGFDDEVSDQICVGNQAGGVPFTGYQSWLSDHGVDGTGVILADVDTGMDTNDNLTAHLDIRGRIAAFVDYTGGAYPTDADGHGTHTGGIMAGNAVTGVMDANGFLFGLGVAPAAQLVVQNALAGVSWPPLGGWQVLSKDSVYQGAVGSNNSWYTGASGAQGYSSACAIHDRMVRDADLDTVDVAEPLIMVFSAGNAGPGASTITEPKEAKNLIVVGASENHRTDDPLGSYCGAPYNIGQIVEFSSRGPALDGRLEPTLVAPGSDIASLRSVYGYYSGCGQVVPSQPTYVYMSGTSMACPHVTGATALVVQWWRGYHSGADPSPAMVKALLVNGAMDMGTPDIPNNNEGWGRMNLDNVILAGLPAKYVDQAHVFGESGQTWTCTRWVSDPSKPVKITLAWTDAPGAVGGNAWVNDLDLQVTVGDVTYLGNVFANGWSTTGGAFDYRNNLENVFIQSTPSARVTIRVIATNIAGDGVPYNADSTDQDFALVASNLTGAATQSAQAPVYLLLLGG